MNTDININSLEEQFHRFVKKEIDEIIKDETEKAKKIIEQRISEIADTIA